MFLKHLSLVNFKNYADFEGSFSERINCFAGYNGTGKTNLLDAIHYLSFCKSHFNSTDSQNIRHNEGFFVIAGNFIYDGEETEIYCAFKRNQKKVFKKNKREYEKLSEHIGQFPLVMVSPLDSDLIYGPGETRRKFLDEIISQYNRTYLEKLIAYSRALKQRNALLKQFQDNHAFDAETLEVWDDQLALHGSFILDTRAAFIEKFIPLFNDSYKFVSESRETPSIAYESTSSGNDLKTALFTSLSKDRAVQFTTVGPHRDDLDFRLNGYNVKKFASQGQQKSYIIALKLAEYEFIRLQKNVKPLLLLDDIYDKLDERRFAKLLSRVSGPDFGQVFITDTHVDRVRKALGTIHTDHRIFSISENNQASLVPNDEGL
jgi:DNA replication and repair protein RecF